MQLCLSFFLQQVYFSLSTNRCLYRRRFYSSQVTDIARSFSIFRHFRTWRHERRQFILMFACNSLRHINDLVKNIGWSYVTTSFVERCGGKEWNIYISKRIWKVSTFYEIFNRWLPEIHWKSLRVVRKPLKYKINFQFLIFFFQRYKQH